MKFNSSSRCRFDSNQNESSLPPSKNIVKKGILILTFLLLFSTFDTIAATFTVTTTADNEANTCSIGQCTLREAISDANALPGNDAVNFQLSVTGTITLTSGHLLISSNITVNGPGARVLSVSGNGSSRVFVVSGSGNTANISGLTITGGNAQPILIGATLIGDGGGILNANGGTLNLTEVNVSGNSATSLGGGVATRAVLLVTTTTNITRSLISNNSAVVGGGGISNVGTDLISSSVINISNSTVTSNTALAEGGGVSNTAGTMHLTNNTISNNQSTIAGGGIVNVAGVLVGSVILRNNILAQNNAVVGLNLVSSDGLGIFQSLGNNLIGNNLDIGASFSASIVIGNLPQPNVNADIVGSVEVGFQVINPLLGTLADNGGQTNTRLLGGGSPAIDRGDNCVLTNSCSVSNAPAALTTDQRGAGFLRLIDGDGNTSAIVDIGAFESQVVPTGTTYSVTNLNDTIPDGCSIGDCTLREAILDANTNPGPDTIVFASGLNGTIPLNIALGQLEITSDISIDGPGARNVSVSGEGNNRVFLVAGVGTNADIEGLGIINGNAQLLGTLLGDGGGVLNVGGSNLNLVEVSINNNSATSLGGGVATRSLLGTISTTYITRSLISNNSAVAGGAGISNIATANIVSSAVTTATNTTITNNNTLAESGGVSNLGGTINLINDTISDNNSVLTGGGVVNLAGVLGLGVTNLRNTIVARNNAVILGDVLSLSDDVLGVFNSLGNNLIGHNLNAEVSFQASVFVGLEPVPNANGDIVGSVSVGTSVINPRLGALQDNGGLTNTRAVNAGSPALNRGNNCVTTDTCATDPSPNTLPAPLITDQRGTGFARVFASVVEIGAYESNTAPTSSSVFIAGRASDKSGNPVSRVIITLTDMSGNVRQAVTNNFGFFRFEGVSVGETYIAAANYRRQSVGSQVVTVNADLTDLNFTVASENLE